MNETDEAPVWPREQCPRTLTVPEVLAWRARNVAPTRKWIGGRVLPRPSRPTPDGQVGHLGDAADEQHDENCAIHDGALIAPVPTSVPGSVDHRSALTSKRVIARRRRFSAVEPVLARWIRERRIEIDRPAAAIGHRRARLLLPPVLDVNEARARACVDRGRATIGGDALERSARHIPSTRERIGECVHALWSRASPDRQIGLVRHAPDRHQREQPVLHASA